MRLLIVARPFVFHGGVERATAGLVTALVEHGLDVHLLTLRGQQPMPGVTVRVLRLPRLPATARVLALAAAVKRVVARGGFDVVQSHERTLGQHVYRAGEGCHRAYLDALGKARRRGLYHHVVLALERRVFRETPTVAAIAKIGQAEIERLYAVPSTRIRVVYNGVDLRRFHPDHRARFRAELAAETELPPGAPALLFVGSGFERKGLATAVKALAKVGDTRARLLVLGRGDAGPYQALAAGLGVADRIAWLGARPDVERWYAAADVVVLPTRYEPFGNVHLEALASGVPVVTTTSAGGAEVIAGEDSGAIVAPGDAAAIAGAVERLLARPEADVRAAARGAAEPFTYAAQATGFTRLYGAPDRASGD